MVPWGQGETQKQHQALWGDTSPSLTGRVTQAGSWTSESGLRGDARWPAGSGLAPPGSPCTRPGGHARPWNGGRPSPQAGAGDVSAEVALRSACAALERGERGRSTRSVSAHGHGPDAHVSGTAAGEDPSACKPLMEPDLNKAQKEARLVQDKARRCNAHGRSLAPPCRYCVGGASRAGPGESFSACGLPAKAAEATVTSRLASPWHLAPNRRTDPPGRPTRAPPRPPPPPCREKTFGTTALPLQPLRQEQQRDSVGRDGPVDGGDCNCSVYLDTCRGGSRKTPTGTQTPLLPSSRRGSPSLRSPGATPSPTSQLPPRLTSSSWSQGSWQVLDPSGVGEQSRLPPRGTRVNTGPSTAFCGTEDRPRTGSPQQHPACVGTARPPALDRHEETRNPGSAASATTRPT
uniref:Uncharacterized protein n=1 Tax=Rangifer tarandus platyrhynchus TaxID=3082113 RepID=A0ACB0DPM9_RANTA|nr:unnamed protein product [Rangifer tarandus platyrhynchus]